MIDQNLARATHLHIGSTMTISQHASPAELAQLPPGLLAPGVDPNFSQSLRVVGIAKSTDSSLNWSTSGGFYAKYGHRLAGFLNEFVVLKSGEADLPRFQDDVQRIVGHPVNVESASDLFGVPKIKSITRVERDGLLLFALAVLIGGGVLVGQALARAVNAGAADLGTWRALGADRKTAIRAMVLPATITAAVGVVVGAGVAIALSPRFPISQARRYDLDIGFHADWVVLGRGGGRDVGDGARDRDRLGALDHLRAPGRERVAVDRREVGDTSGAPPGPRHRVPPRGRAGPGTARGSGPVGPHRRHRRRARGRRLFHVPRRPHQRRPRSPAVGDRLELRGRVG